MESYIGEKKVWVTYPACQKTGAVPVDRPVVEGVLEQEADSSLRLIVFPGDICEYTFMVKVDANLKVRQE